MMSDRRFQRTVKSIKNSQGEGVQPRRHSCPEVNQLELVQDEHNNAVFRVPAGAKATAKPRRHSLQTVTPVYNGLVQTYGEGYERPGFMSPVRPHNSYKPFEESNNAQVSPSPQAVPQYPSQEMLTKFALIEKEKQVTESSKSAITIPVTPNDSKTDVNDMHNKVMHNYLQNGNLNYDSEIKHHQKITGDTNKNYSLINSVRRLFGAADGTGYHNKKAKIQKISPVKIHAQDMEVAEHVKDHKDMTTETPREDYSNERTTAESLVDKSEYMLEPQYFTPPAKLTLDTSEKGLVPFNGRKRARAPARSDCAIM